MALAAACGSESGPIECETNSNCNLHPGGECTVNPSTNKRWCTYEDATCTSGRRWSDLDVGDGVSGTCVDDELPDAGVDAMVDAAVTDAGVDADMNDAMPMRPVLAIAAGGYQTCALLSTGKVRCWGQGNFGFLGYGDTQTVGDDESPFQKGDIDIGRDVTQLGGVSNGVCVLTTEDKVRCWGNVYSYANTNVIGDNETPASAGDVMLGQPISSVRRGGDEACAITSTGGLICWGDNTAGKLGYGHTNYIGDNEHPSSAGLVDVGGPVDEVAPGYNATCARQGTNVRCWGDAVLTGFSEAIGDNEPPSSVGYLQVGGDVAHIVHGGSYICVLRTDNKVRCWGNNGTSGTLGIGSTVGYVGVSAAQDVDLGTGQILQLVGGNAHVCALIQGGTVRCWGSATFGQLGYGNTENIGDDEDPVVAGDVNVGGTVIQLAAGAVHTCALLMDGAVRCWGRNQYGQLGYGNMNTIGDDEAPATAGNVPLL